MGFRGDKISQKNEIKIGHRFMDYSHTNPLAIFVLHLVIEITVEEDFDLLLLHHVRSCVDSRPDSE